MILTSGCFDGLHFGHCAYLREADKLREPNELMMIAVAEDDYIRRHKGREPQWPLNQRMSVLMLYALHRREWSVVSHDANGVAELVNRLKPRLLVKGKDWSNRIAADVVAACERTGCELRIVESYVDRHTSDALAAQ